MTYLPAMLLQATNIHKTYKLGKVAVPVLRGVDISIMPGEFITVLGASGSGKSTLLHILGGLDRADTTTPPPSITFKGANVGKFSVAQADEYRQRDIGFVFQFYHLLPELTVVENVVIAAMIRQGRFGYRSAAAESRAKDILSAFGLAHRFGHRPAELSGGERQRVAIARALINGPSLLLADEPTGNLDRTTGKAILEQLSAYRQSGNAGQQQLTMIMVTHDQELAARADRTIRLVDGLVEGPVGGAASSKPVLA